MVPSWDMHLSPCPARTVNTDLLIDPSHLDRARGAWLGQIVGDALGTTVEFQPAESIAKRFPQGLRDVQGGGPFGLAPGQVTDDTELAMALARSLVAEGGFAREAVAAAYQAWYRSGPFDIGGTTRTAFGVVARAGATLADTMERVGSRQSQANGSLMRQSPLGIFGWQLEPDALAAISAADSRLSHPHAMCQASCAVFTHAIAFAIRTGADPRSVYEETVAFAQTSPLCEPARPVLALAASLPPPDYQRHMGWVTIALQNAFYQLMNAPSFEEGLVDTVMQGGDSDTNGCIAGALLGAVHGEESIPARWRETVLACSTPRPDTYRNGDARELAARLLEVGAGRATAPPNASSYERELAVAVHAARAAGALLLAEAKRPEGPRGGNHHADVDDEMEAEIVRVLARAFPDDAIVAEEGGSRDGTSGRAFLVDPHDGTSDFLRGRRETSVSIALVDRGRLVVGVVYCPCLCLLDADDPLRALVGPGDDLLMTWALGRPVCRDSEPIDPPPARDLGPESRVLVSASVRGRGLSANARAVEPARIVPCGSIATRLALAAIGVADVALTFQNRLASWDFAAGQALLIGAGGDLVGPGGEPIAWNGIHPARTGLLGYFGARSRTLAAAVADRYFG